MVDWLTALGNQIQTTFTQPNTLRSVLLFVACIVVVYWLSHFVARVIIKVAQIVAARSESESREDRLVRLRQIETYLSVTVAIVRVALVIVLGYIAWRIFSPDSSGASIAAIGAGTIFVVLAGQTIGSLLKDITAGATMIIEKWFNVGDHIKIEPFGDISGIVERFTLRSTRLRSLSGEIIWIHNQQIAAVQVTPRGVRTLAVDVFAKNKPEGEKVIQEIIASIPTGSTLLAQPLRITSIERWHDNLWRITIIGETLPGREWLIERYFINALKTVDEDKKKSERIFVQEPIVRYADPEADRRFKRAVRIHNN